MQIPQWLHELSLNFPPIRSEACQKPLLQFRPRPAQSGGKAVNEPVEWKGMHYHLQFGYESEWLEYQQVPRYVVIASSQLAPGLFRVAHFRVKDAGDPYIR